MQRAAVDAHDVAADIAGALGREEHDDVCDLRGGGGAPDVALPSAAVSLPESYAAPLRTGTPAVVGRLEGGRCLLDLRTVAPDDDSLLAQAVLACTS